MDDDYRDVVAIEVCHVQKPIVWVEGNANWFRTHGYGGYNKFERGIGLLYCRQQEMAGLSLEVLCSLCHQRRMKNRCLWLL